MLKILELLNKSRIIKSYEVQDFRQGSDFYYIKVLASLPNNTFLYVRQYVSDEEYSYSYHWQEKNGQLIIRWDNAPHHKKISTYPHHKHISGCKKVEPSKERDLLSVMSHISKCLPEDKP